MLVVGDSTTWTAVGTSAFAAVVVLVAILLLIRWRRSSGRQLESVQAAAARTETIVTELGKSLARMRAESDAMRTQSERAEQETARLRLAAEFASLLDLDAVARRALERAAEDVGADAATLVLERGEDGEPYTACYGLTSAEAERELLGLPPGASDARAVTIRYRYSAEEKENDAFRLCSGLAVPIVTDAGRIGTLAVFWRRDEHEADDADVGHLEELGRTVATPLESAQRFEEMRRLAETDPLTGLPNGSYFAERFVRECARARRYERRLALVVFDLDGSADDRGLVAFGRQLRAAVRSADVPCHVGRGEFIVIAPEAALFDAERLAERMRFTRGSRGRGTEPDLACGTAELGELDSAGSLLDRARAEAQEFRSGERGAAASPTGP
jgi:GGDEF domain-containing protein